MQEKARDRTASAGMDRRTFIPVLAGATAAPILAASAMKSTSTAQAAEQTAGSASDSIDSSASGEQVVITSQGSAESQVMPDMASLSMWVQANEQDAASASEEASAMAEAVMAALLDAGVPKGSITTTGVSVYPHSTVDPYAYADTGTSSDSSSSDKPTSYDASVAFNLDDIAIDTLADVTQAALDAGVTQIGSLYYYASNTMDTYREALVEAVKQAIASAQAIADALGLGEVEISEVEEQQNGNVYRMYSNYSLDTGAKASAEEANSISADVANATEIPVDASVTLKALALKSQ